jgi:hypothetical protein
MKLDSKEIYMDTLQAQKAQCEKDIAALQQNLVNINEKIERQKNIPKYHVGHRYGWRNYPDEFVLVRHEGKLYKVYYKAIASDMGRLFLFSDIEAGITPVDFKHIPLDD